MCDYSLHALASRPAEVGETLVSTSFRGTSTRGFASAKDPAIAVCMLPGTELAFASDVKYDNRWIWTRTINWRVGKFNQIGRDTPDRHHDAIEFPDGSHVLVLTTMAARAGQDAHAATPRARYATRPKMFRFAGLMVTIGNIAIWVEHPRTTLSYRPKKFGSDEVGK